MRTLPFISPTANISLGVDAVRLFAAALLCCSLSLDSSIATAGTNAVPMMRVVPHRLLLQPRAGLAEAELDKALRPYNAKRVQHIKPINVYVIELPAAADEVVVGRALMQLPIIKFVEADRAIEPAQTPNDPYYANSWHLPKIGADKAWDAAAGNAVTIAVLDSGVDATHPDLVSRVTSGWNFYDNSANTSDVSGHGTRMAGIAAASGNNGQGVTGVDWRARIMPLRVTDVQGCAYDTLIAQALIFAADHGARVANLSFPGASQSETVLSAAQYMRNKGGVVVVAAGNTGHQESDAASDLLTVVAATDLNDAPTAFSSSGNHIDVAAPGVSVWTTTLGGGYASVSGTSASSAIVAGVYGLMLSANPKLLPATLKRILVSTAAQSDTPHRDAHNGWGRIDAAAAVSKAKLSVERDISPPNTTVAASAAANGIATIDASASDNIGVTRVELYVNGALMAAEISAPYAFALDTTSLPNGTASIYTRAYDAAGNASNSPTYAVAIANDAVTPTVNITSPQNGASVAGAVPITVRAADSNRIARLSLFINGQEVAVAYGTSLSYTWSAAAKNGTPVPYIISARAWDPAGNSAATSISVSR